MFSQSCKVAFCVALLSLNLQCAKPSNVLSARQDGDSQEQGADVPPQEQSPVVSLGQDKFGVVEFPLPFMRQDKDSKVMITRGAYEVRQLPDSPHNELLIAAQDYDDAYSENIYAVSLDGRFQVRAVTEQEWNQAKRLPSSRRGELSFGLIAPTEVGIKYRDRVYPHTGKTWTQTEAFPSPSGKWLAVFGDSSEESKTPGIPGFSGGGRTKGEMFVDVYDTSTGEKIMAGRASHSGGHHPSFLFNNSLWAGNRYLIVPLDLGPGEAFFVGILSDK